MNWTMIGTTFGFMVLGYLIGSISNAVWITKLLKHEDVREKGSGNAGATNVTRNYGKKIGGVVFILDMFKPVLAMLIGWAVYKFAGVQVLIPAIGLAAVIGHIWPVFFGFKGGKGAASMLGYMTAVQWALFPIGFVIFSTIVFTSRKVSLGSILASLALIIVNIIFGFTLNHETMQWMSPMTTDLIEPWWINTIIMSIIWLLVTYKHKDNIKRLLNGTERSIGEKK